MKNTTKLGLITHGDSSEKKRRERLLELFRSWAIPNDEFFLNLGLFLTPQTLSRILFMDFLYKQIIEVQGIIIEFGCRWGQTVNLFCALRGIYEPFNRLRKIVGFDTFEGLSKLNVKDGHVLKDGMYTVTQDYDVYLREIMKLQEKESPLSHINKHEIVRGDATIKIHDYLEQNPETIIALAYFDLDIYEPTKECLKAIKRHLTRGSILGFDELNDHICPGETLALQEVLGLGRFHVRRYRYNARTSYIIIDEPLYD